MDVSRDVARTMENQERAKVMERTKVCSIRSVSPNGSDSRCNITILPVGEGAKGREKKSQATRPSPWSVEDTIRARWRRQGDETKGVNGTETEIERKRETESV